MRDIWVGDKGDFGKYGMLREVCRILKKSGHKAQLGVVWCFNPDDGHNPSRIFHQMPCRPLDLPMQEFFRELARPNGPSRTVTTVQARRILPTNIYLGVDQRHIELSVASMTREGRAEWAGQAIKEMRHADLVFLDPDTGISPPGKADKDNRAIQRGQQRRRSEKHLYVDELLRFRNAGKSLIIYQDAQRQSIQYRFNWLTRSLEKGGIERNAIRVFHWPSRFFVWIVHPKHDFIHAALNEFKRTCWYSP